MRNFDDQKGTLPRTPYRALAVLAAIAFALIQASVIFLVADSNLDLFGFLPQWLVQLDLFTAFVILLPPVITMVIYYFLFERKIDQGLAVILAIYSGFCGWALGMIVCANFFGS